MKEVILTATLILMSVFLGFYLAYMFMVMPAVEAHDIAVDMHEACAHELELVSKVTDDLKEENSELNLLYDNALNQIDILISMRNAGMVETLSITDIRLLLEKTDRIPYGSPFSNGHWVSSPYGLRDESEIKGNNYTEGIDLVGKKGDTTVRATADGEIIEFGYSDTYGKYIIMEHPGGFRTKYSHLSTIYWQNENKEVKNIHINKGDRIGVMGNTGTTFSDNGGDGTHLDYRIYIEDPKGVWTPLNPTEIIAYTGN